MELYIRIKDGQPFEHPILGDNFRQAFPDVDTNNLPADFAKFIRVERPMLGPYEKNQILSYQLVDGVYFDVFSCEQMTTEEILLKQTETKTNWTFNNGYASWIFDETICGYIPPIPKPIDNKRYRWNEQTIAWNELT
jgi:hypothetical protein